MKKYILLPVFLCSLLFVGACQQQKHPYQGMSQEAAMLAYRGMQTRKFETEDSNAMLQATTNVLQDLGFNIKEFDEKLGVITAEKTRDATSGGQVTAAILVRYFTGSQMSVDDKQTIKASIVVRPFVDQKSGKTNSEVRINFQRFITNTHGFAGPPMTIMEPAIYAGFFDKLSKSVFLEAQQI